MTRAEAHNYFTKVLTQAKDDGCEIEAMRQLCKINLFYLLVYVIGRSDVDCDWLYDRCEEIQENPDGYLDLWAREHYKSTIITYAKTIQDILINPNITIGIFSHTRGIAKSFLAQIKRTLESCDTLRDLFSDIIPENPSRDVPCWSLDTGIIVLRDQNPKESTVEAWGLVDGQPIGKHFDLLVYDDVVTPASVNTPEQIEKTTEALSLSYNLGAHGGRRRFIGTRYHFNDTYREVMARKTVIPRIKPATDDGKVEGEPVFLEREVLVAKRRDMGPYVFNCQMMQNPIADGSQGFKEEWLKHWTVKNFKNMNIYIIVDPASKKKKTSDYTSMWVIGLGPDKNIYVIDIVRDRLNLSDRRRTLFHLHRTYEPIMVGYEEYGLQADIEHFQEEMERENYRFHIQPLGGKIAKEDRIKSLVPLFEQGRIYLPNTCVRSNYENVQQDLVRVFIEDEYKVFPVPVHDDMLDSLARIKDPKFPAKFPMIKKHTQTRQHNRPARCGYGG